ncbi:putative ATP_binding Histidine kinase A component of the two component sensory system (plasmid) [Cupriavidus taiwanensis]|uniref:histidine kinase n=2 Tax=Cupriavidus taiwanensis TaxID=164546 RepID=A0A375GE17_9BURK|nr:putative ATP_binding Histidine kinase A component of the two component sensory system [Cupriavidus taiwanensis]SOZ08882.1 putative ATP_binding Histidine kinase A component of the two component sensory system [Cupriavidus taiwanensis]SOZ11194.1 putative ATP_binding Histidine kinase A component of the two component sensory system [Cupriavidus taiwanensis]SOZ42544.1 putative ATP_binding Histidine kinase A component of the two component sensory system [Cupriavidus taiwanensis]SPC20241.1 putative
MAGMRGVPGAGLGARSTFLASRQGNIHGRSGLPCPLAIAADPHMTQRIPPSGLPGTPEPHSVQSPDPPASNAQLAGSSGSAEPVRSVQEVSTLIEQSAHDLRSSLNAIQSWAYVLDRAFDTTPAPAQRALDGIRSGMQQQLALIEEMEEAVRLLADESPPRWQQVDLRALAIQAIADRRQAAEARGVLLSALSADGSIWPAPPAAAAAVTAPGATDAVAAYCVDGDAARLAPLLRHLLVHCIWRAPAGGAVSVHLFSEPDYVKLRITESPSLDSQRSASRLAALTDFFGRRPPQAGEPPSRQSSALLLTRRMVEMHGAVLSAESDGCDSDKVSVCIAVRFPRHMRRP